MLNTHKAKIGATEFVITEFLPRQQFLMFCDLQKDVMPVIMAMASGEDPKDGEESKFDGAAFASALGNVDSVLLDKWISKLISTDNIAFQVGNNPLQKINAQNFDMAFANFYEIGQLLFEICKVNFAAPLEGLLKGISTGTGIAGIMKRIQ